MINKKKIKNVILSFVKKFVKPDFQDNKPDFQDNFVVCENCGVMVKKEKAQEVEMEDEVIGWKKKFYYCSRCKKPYDKIKIIGGGGFFGEVASTSLYFKNIYFKNIQVDEKGNPIVSKNKKGRK